MKNKVLKTIKKYKLIENGDKLVLGVSGGPDSIAMLNILNDLRQREKEITKVITKDISEEDKATFKKVLEQMQKNCSDLLKQNKN